MQASQTKPRENGSCRGSLVTDPVPRRGAPASIASTLTRRPNESDGDESEDEVDSQPPTTHDSAPQHGDGEEGFDDFASSSSFESVTRVGELDKMPSLFQGKESVKQLDGAKSRKGVWPSYQQQAVPPSDAPRDYRLESSRSLLQEPTPSIRRSTHAPTHRGNNARQHNDSEDEFQTDTRLVTDRRSVREPPPPVRNHLHLPEDGTRPLPSARTPLDARASQSSASAGGSSYEADFGARSRHRVLSPRHTQIELDVPYTLRKRWSDKDTNTLLRLIRQCNAAWATIERNHNGEFEYARNQQAYRDKARNLKVEMLMRDDVLPPRFDHVTLAKKEIDKLIACGKNPRRRERDIDEHGHPVNTEW